MKKRELHNRLNSATWDSYVTSLSPKETIDQEVRWNLILCLRDIIPSLLIVTTEETS